jgi:hypothetical protein
MLAHPAVHEYDGQSKEWLERADGSEGITNWKYMEDNGHVPDYLHDLNAMHDAETFGGAEVIKCMRFWLFRICDEMTAHHASAAQRAEALLRTLNLWIDNEP